MSEPTETPPPAVPPGTGETSVIRQMRAASDAASAAAREAVTRAEAAEKKLLEIERAGLAETERLRLELADAQKVSADFGKLKETATRYEGAFEKQYNAQLSQLPEEKRATAQALTQGGTWADRVEALEGVRALIGVTTPSQSVGAPLRPGTPAPPPAAPPAPPAREFKDFGNVGWGEVLKPTDRGKGPV